MNVCDRDQTCQVECKTEQIQIYYELTEYLANENT